MKKLCAKLFVLIMSAVLIFNFSACGKDNQQEVPTITADEAYNAIANAVNKSVTNLNQIALTVNGTAIVKTKENNESGEGSDSESQTTLKTNTYTAKANVSIILDENRKINKAKANVKLTDTAEDSSLIFEAYVKDGYSYTYTNIFGSNYGYDEMDDDPIEISETDRQNLNEYLSKAKAELPTPTATKNGNEITTVWTVTSENLGDYIKAVYKIKGDEISDDDVSEMIADIRVNNGKLTLVTDGDNIKSLSVELNAQKGEESIIANLSAIISVSGVEITFDTDRLAEIQAAATPQ